MACRNEFDRMHEAVPAGSAAPRTPIRQPTPKAGRVARLPHGRTHSTAPGRGSGSVAQPSSRASPSIRSWPSACRGSPRRPPCPSNARTTSHTSLGDVNLLFRPTGREPTKPLAISFCNHEPQSLWRRLDRLKKQWEAAKGATSARSSCCATRASGRRETAQDRLDGPRRGGDPRADGGGAATRRIGRLPADADDGARRRHRHRRQAGRDRASSTTGPRAT